MGDQHVADPVKAHGQIALPLTIAGILGGEGLTYLQPIAVTAERRGEITLGDQHVADLAVRDGARPARCVARR